MPGISTQNSDPSNAADMEAWRTGGRNEKADSYLPASSVTAATADS